MFTNTIATIIHAKFQFQRPCRFREDVQNALKLKKLDVNVKGQSWMQNLIVAHQTSQWYTQKWRSIGWNRHFYGDNHGSHAWDQIGILGAYISAPMFLKFKRSRKCNVNNRRTTDNVPWPKLTGLSVDESKIKCCLQGLHCLSGTSLNVSTSKSGSSHPNITLCCPTKSSCLWILWL